MFFVFYISVCYTQQTETKLPKIEITKIIQSGGFAGKLLEPLMRSGLLSAKDLLTSLAKNVLHNILLHARFTKSKTPSNVKIIVHQLRNGLSDNLRLRIS